MISTRSGVTLYMILAMLLGLVIIGTTFAINSLRKVLPPPFLLEQKADYQMESAFVFCLSRLNTGLDTSSGEPLVRQEIAPGAWLSVTARPDGADAWLLDAVVKAETWSRTLSAKAVRNGRSEPSGGVATQTESPASGTAQAESPAPAISPAESAGSWRIFFLPGGTTP